eukprot:2560782-Heterocapsa_arctica.AAC.1
MSNRCHMYQVQICDMSLDKHYGYYYVDVCRASTSSTRSATSLDAAMPAQQDNANNNKLNDKTGKPSEV